ncbi:DegV family protein [Bacillus solitudinis]|uniref:DegV family protein n=1 Tax=Bacillus solitudinis TaxID=2014074 RepID=UPI000C2318B2|nr:DegV family protein [Bacillus solitudinis]
MANVKIVTDSTADIPKALAEQLNIKVVPLKVIFSEAETYEDGVDLSASEFYKKLSASETIPTTSQPTPFQFEETYRNLMEQGDTEIISIHLSSQLSGTYQAATIAKQSLEGEVKIHVVDSKRASYGIGLIVIELARMAEQGKSMEECLARLDDLLVNTKIYFMVDTLEYLQKNGRIGRASALLGSLLKIKPILSLNEEGVVFPFEKVRGQKKALNRIIEILKEDFGDEPIHIGSSHAINEALSNELLVRMKNEFNVKSEVLTEIGSVIGAHVGPGAIALMVTKAKP